MKYVHEVEISEIKEIGEICGKLSHAYFYIKYKDGSREKFTIATKDNTSYELARKMKTEILKEFNKYNNIPETYLLENEVYITINGETVHFGTRCINNLQDLEVLTLKEIDEMRKQFKIRDEGWRHLSYCQLFSIEENK